MSRLYRFLLSDALIFDWGVVRQLIDKRDILDHCPIWLVINQSGWGPKPSKVNDRWFKNVPFLPYVESEWKDIQVEGRSDFVLKEKMKRLKDILRRWDKEHFRRIDLDIEERFLKINEVDLLLESCNEKLKKEVVMETSEATAAMWKKIM